MEDQKISSRTRELIMRDAIVLNAPQRVTLQRLQVLVEENREAISKRTADHAANVIEAEVNKDE